MEFKKDDYVVLTEADFNLTGGYTIGNVYKINRSGNSLNSKDDMGWRDNGYNTCTYDNTGRIKWRYATTEEKAMYDKEDKPCFVGIEAIKEVEFVEDTKEEDDYTKEIEEFLISCSVK